MNLIRLLWEGVLAERVSAEPSLTIEVAQNVQQLYSFSHDWSVGTLGTSQSTVRVIEKKLARNGVIYRFLPVNPNAREAGFAACSFWMAQNLAGVGRHSEAERLFEVLVKRCNDVGLLSEEYDPNSREFRGNFPQALSHIALINAARSLGRG